MKILALILTGTLLAASFCEAQVPLVQPEKKKEAESPHRTLSVTSEEALAAFAVAPPDEGSPFFMDQAMARQAMSSQGQVARRESEVAVYPKAKGSEDSAPVIFSKFFTTMFSSVRFGPIGGTKTSEDLTIEPKEFALKDRREVTVTYVIRNNTKKMIRFDYPTSQRIDILTRDPQGNVVDRWSDDRAFDNQEGVVVVNPNERIEYSERIPTREMKAGETYQIEAEVANHPDFTTTQPISPR